MSLRRVADALALRGIPSPTGKLVWEVNQVRIVLGRLDLGEERAGDG